MVSLINILEVILLTHGKALSLDDLQKAFADDEQPSKTDLKTALRALQMRYNESGIELVEVATGYRIQSKVAYAPWLLRFMEEKPAKYSRALLEVLAVIAYRQPVTRADIEEIRGVAVNSVHMKTLLEREWVRICGYRDVPGKPAMYVTTKAFLDYFNLKSLDALPEVLAPKQQDLQAAAMAAQETKEVS